MHIAFANLDTCKTASGVVVVIDVIRAFTTAAYAFAAGADEIIITGGVDEALHLRQRFPDSLIMGEVDGVAVPGFDFGNSPAALQNLDLRGKRLIQRTSAGTQGVVLCRRAASVFTASFVVARATVQAVQALAPKHVTLVHTASYPGEEDIACAQYLAELLIGNSPSAAPYLESVQRSEAARKFYDVGYPEFDVQDMPCCLECDRFDFAMSVQERDDLLVMTHS